MPKPTVPAISVVIPTRNRRDLLASTLEALDGQIGVDGGIEGVVADDGSSDGTSAWLAANRSRFGFPLTVVELPGLGPAAARNRGIERAASDRILLLGDDTRPAADLVAAHLRMAAGREIGVQGRIEWDSGGPVTPVMRFLAPEGPQFYFRGLVNGEPIPYTVQYGANLSAPARWFRNDPFDETFPHAAFEDTELAFRWRRRRRTVVYCESAICRHRHHYESIEGFLEKQFSAGRAARYAARLHPGMAARTVVQPFLVGVLHGARHAMRRIVGRGREKDRWDLACRIAFFRGFLSS
jgi:glycosyltransferase involved in cell wall biosynthesis